MDGEPVEPYVRSAVREARSRTGVGSTQMLGQLKCHVCRCMTAYVTLICAALRSIHPPWSTLVGGPAVRGGREQKRSSSRMGSLLGHMLGVLCVKHGGARVLGQSLSPRGQERVRERHQPQDAAPAGNSSTARYGAVETHQEQVPQYASL